MSELTGDTSHVDSIGHVRNGNGNWAENRWGCFLEQGNSCTIAERHVQSQDPRNNRLYFPGGGERGDSPSGKLRHGSPMIQYKSDGGRSISEHVSSKKMKLCQIHTCVVSVN